MSTMTDQGKEIAYKMHKAVFLLDKMSDQVLQDRLGLGFSQLLVLMVLAGQPNAPQKFVAAQLDQTQAAVSRQVDLLVGRKLVSRTQNKDNRREYVLSLTKAGRKACQDGQSEVGKHFGKLFSAWARQEKAVLAKALDWLVVELRKKGSHK